MASVILHSCPEHVKERWCAPDFGICEHTASNSLRYYQLDIFSVILKMRVVTFSSAALSLLASSVSASPVSFQARDYGSNDVISRDVVVVGGGSGGTYSAVSLKDKGKSVLIIEKKDRLGGHTETYM